MAVEAPLTRLALLDAFPWLRYTVTTRDARAPVGGDMSFTTGADDRAGVVANRVRWLASLGQRPETAVMSGLVHGTTVRRVGKHHGGCGITTPDTVLAHTDGLTTNEPGVALMMCFADCVPLLILDPKRRSIGLAHAGWRGTLAGMAAALVGSMVQEYASDPADLVAVIGPSIGPEAYVVGADLVTAFTRAYPDDPIITRRDDGSYLNLWEANRSQCIRAGLRGQAVSVAGLCTFAQGDRFFSHRYARAYDEREGRFAVLMTIEG